MKLINRLYCHVAKQMMFVRAVVSVLSAIQIFKCIKGQRVNDSSILLTCWHSPDPFGNLQLRVERGEVFARQLAIAAQLIHKHKKSMNACHSQAEIAQHRLNE